MAVITSQIDKPFLPAIDVSFRECLERSDSPLNPLLEKFRQRTRLVLAEMKVRHQTSEVIEMRFAKESFELSRLKFCFDIVKRSPVPFSMGF